MSGGFRLNAKHVFLTYPRTSAAASKLALRDHIVLLTPRPEHYRIAEERHADGATHLHALLVYGSRINIKRADHYDFMGHHPNITAVRSPKRVYNYCGKEDPAPLDSGSIGSHLGLGASDADRTRSRRDFVDLAREGRTEEAREAFINKHPKDYLVNRERVEDALTALAPKKPRPILGGWREPDGFAWDQSKSLHIWGGPNLGKTEWAKHLAGGDYCFITHIDDLKRLKGEKYLLFDDLNFLTYPREFAVALCDVANDRSIHCRYHPARIPAGTYRIFTSNEENIWPEDPHGALQRRLQTIHVCGKLYLQPADHQEEEEQREGPVEADEVIPGTPQPQED